MFWTSTCPPYALWESNMAAPMSYAPPYSFLLQPGFSSPGRSCLKTAVMMIGEFDFDDTFNSDVTVPGVTWFLFIVFLIVMTLLLMNLLVITLITERFSNDFEQPIIKLLHWLKPKGANCARNKSEFQAMTRNLFKAQEKSRAQGAIGFAKRGNHNRVISFDSHFKTVVSFNLV